MPFTVPEFCLTRTEILDICNESISAGKYKVMCFSVMVKGLMKK